MTTYTDAIASNYSLSKITSLTIPYVLRNVLIKCFYLIYEPSSNMNMITSKSAKFMTTFLMASFIENSLFSKFFLLLSLRG